MSCQPRLRQLAGIALEYSPDTSFALGEFDMQPIAEAFLERTWDDDAESARTARDERAAQLQDAGYECACVNLWNVAGYRVYVVSAEPVETRRIVPSASNHAQRRRLATPERAVCEMPDDGAPNKPDTSRRPDRRRVVTEVR
jgi:hypothetical protein